MLIIVHPAINNRRVIMCELIMKVSTITELPVIERKNTSSHYRRRDDVTVPADSGNRGGWTSDDPTTQLARRLVPDD